MTTIDSMLVLTENLPPATGGSGRYLWEIYRRQVKPRVVMVSSDHPSAHEFDRTHAVPIYRDTLAMKSWGVGNLAGLAGYRRYWRLARTAVREHKVRQVHCGRCIPEGVIGWLMKKRYRIPYVCFAHGEELNYASSSRELRWLAHRALNGADFVIANSRNTQSILTSNWNLPVDRVRVLHPGVDTERFVPAPRDPAIRSQFGWGDRPVVLTVGRLQRRKGQDTMIRALGEIRKTIPNVLYSILGDGEERATLDELAQREGHQQHVQFLSELSDDEMIAAYQQCDVFVLANRQVDQDIEGFGMVLLEAQACGKPVIAGASGGTAETMRIPETGRIVNCEGPSELAPTVVTLLRDLPLRERMGRAARVWVEENFNWDVLSQQAVDLFGFNKDTEGAGMPTLAASEIAS